MSIYEIPVVKGKGTVSIDSDALPVEVYAEALRLGLKELVNRKMSKITVAKLEGEKLAEAQAAAMKQAQENLEAIMKGDIRYSGQKAQVKVSGAVNTEAMRIARNIIKDAIKANKGKISHYKASEISAAAKELLKGEQGAAILKTAEENLNKAKAPGIDLSALVGGMKEDPELVAKAEAAKAKKKETLSAAQAGKVTKRAKPQAGATLQ